jgi:ArsR family transcriptional regulator
LLQAAADPVRLSVLRLLSTAPACVCELQRHVPIPASLLSYHLKVLREAGLITAHRRGRWIDYTLTEEACGRLHAALPTHSAATTAPGMAEDTRNARLPAIREG